MNLDTKEIKARLATKKLQLTPAQQVKNSIIEWFMREQPPADEISLVDGSLKQSLRNTSYWEAIVQTTVFFPTIGPKQHISRVFFYVDSRFNIINKKVNFKTS